MRPRRFWLWLALISLNLVVGTPLGLGAVGVHAQGASSLPVIPITHQPLPAGPQGTIPLPVGQATASSYSAAQDSCGYYPANLVAATNCIWASASGDEVGAWIRLTLSGSWTVTALGFNTFGPSATGVRIRTADVSFDDGSTQHIALDDAESWQQVPVSPVVSSSIEITVTSVYLDGPRRSFNGIVLKQIQPYGAAQNNPPQLPTAPTDLQAIGIDSADIRLVWTNSATNADSIQIYDGATNQQISMVDGAATAATLSNLAPGSHYCACIYAYNTAGFSGPSNTACADTPSS